jgi:hypothetical protein
MDQTGLYDKVVGPEVQEGWRHPEALSLVVVGQLPLALREVVAVVVLVPCF